MSFSTITIGTKIGLGFFLAGVSLLIVFWKSPPAVHQTKFNDKTLWSQIEAEKTHSLRIALAMLQVRRAERDFLKKNDHRDIDKVNASIDKVIENAEALKAIETIKGESTEISERIIREIKAYRTSFISMVKTAGEIGLDHTPGLQSELQKLTHELEVKLTNFDSRQLKYTFLKIQHAEINVNLQSDSKYTEKHRQLVDLFQNILKETPLKATTTENDKNEIQRLLVKYTIAFEQQILHKTKLNEATVKMSTAVHMIETQIEKKSTTLITK